MEITDTQKEKIQKIAETYGLKLVLFFGSQVHGKTHAESDIDIGVLPKKALSFPDEVNLATAFIHTFGMKADFTNLYTASPLLLSEVAKNCVILYQRGATDFADFFVYARQRYVENAPLFLMTRRAVQRFAQTQQNYVE